MNNSCGLVRPSKNRERGAARLKFILTIAIIAVVVYVGFQYVPVAYQSERFKSAMKDDVRDAWASGASNDSLRAKLMADAKEWSVPPNAEITVQRNTDGTFQARVQYTRPIAFPGYTHNYNFDYTAKSTGFIDAK
ncbi:MAG: hypothetical protein QOF02_281 [Blastocatellia bacterium]|jgi:hypothetical protein|nr:hypothetical protein [Blastocatellia bacterium]